MGVVGRGPLELTLQCFFPLSPPSERNGVAKLNIYFKELNYKTNSESPSVTVGPALVREPGSPGGRVALREDGGLPLWGQKGLCWRGRR